MGSEHHSLLFRTSVRWLSRGKVLARLFELRYEINQFLSSQNNHHLHQYLEDDRWISKVAHMPDIFEHLNELKMQVQNRNILTCSDKLKGFKRKIEL